MISKNDLTKKTLTVSNGEIKSTYITTDILNLQTKDHQYQITANINLAQDLQLQMPLTNGEDGQVLATDGKGVTSWVKKNDTDGTVKGPSKSTIGDIVTWGNENGTLIADGKILADNIVQNTETTVVALEIASFADNTGRKIQSSGYCFPEATAVKGQVLSSLGGSQTKWVDATNGNVVGPTQPTTTGDVAIFADTTGTVLADSNIKSSELVTCSSYSADNQIAVFVGDSGKIIRSDGLNADDLLYKSSLAQPKNSQVVIIAPTGSETSFDTAPISLPSTIGTKNQVLSSQGDGTTIWSDGGSGTGNVIGPSTSELKNIAIFDSTNGTKLADSGMRLPNSLGNDGQLLVSKGNGNTAWIDAPIGDVKNDGNATANNFPMYKDNTGKLIIDSGISQSAVVTSGGSGIALGTIPSYLNDRQITPSPYNLINLVVSFSQNAPNTIATFSDANNKIVSSGLKIPPTLPTSNGQVLIGNTDGSTNWATNASGNGDVKGPDSSVDNRVVAFSGTTGKLLKQMDFSLPSSAGSVGQILSTNGDGTTKWVDYVPPSPNPLPQVDFYYLPGSYTWVKNEKATSIQIFAIGGGGGGSCISQNTTVPGFGYGGSGGARLETAILTANSINATATIIVGKGGSGEIVNGMRAISGTDSSFDDQKNKFVAKGGVGAGEGHISPPTTGSPDTTQNQGGAGGKGAESSLSPTATNGGNSILAGGGGGGSNAIGSYTNTQTYAGNGGEVVSSAQTIIGKGGADGNPNSPNGKNGENGIGWQLGQAPILIPGPGGGGGGAGTSSGNGGNGGNGGLFGGGGGAGGGGVRGKNGNGGNGADGCVIIYQW